MNRRIPVGRKAQPEGESDIGLVVHHGRDAAGVYTRLEFEDGRKEEWHPDWLREVEA